jgi:phospholipid/cholesterol/gamma-HCH transport system substrate-binding protein
MTINVPRPRLRSRIDRNVAIGVGALAVIVLITGLILTQVYRGWFAAGSHTVTAVFAAAPQLYPGDEVRVDGIKAGTIGRVSLDPGARAATVVMRVDDSAGPFYADASAQLRWKTVLGGSFYVALARGTKRSGALSGATIPLSRTSGQIELDDVTSAFQPDARQGLQTMLGQTSTALADPLVPGRVLRTLNRVAGSVAGAMAALRGAQPDADLRQLLAATGATMNALNAPNQRLQALIQGAASTVVTTAARGADLRRTIDQSPAALASTITTLDQLDTTLGLANPLIARLQRPATMLAPTVGPLRPTLTEADALLRKTVPLMTSLRPAVASLADTSQQGLPLLQGVSPSLARLANNILPYLNAKDPRTQHSTAEMVGPTFEGLGSSAGGQLDNNGHFIRFPATVGSASLYLPCQEYLANPDAQMLVECETLQQALTTLLSYNPLGAGSGSGPTSAASNGAKR